MKIKHSLVAAVLSATLCGAVQADDVSGAAQAKPIGAVYGGMGGFLLGGFLSGGPLGAVVGGLVGIYAGDSAQDAVSAEEQKTPDQAGVTAAVNSPMSATSTESAGRR